ncbi:MAG: PilN domain-containing protein [Halobacteriovoraceae bacterium]|nr:PilN domain-containing protein [Halobacteriovoraceae bacterium]
MIKINLLKRTRKISLPMVLGVDFNELNFKLIIFSIILLFIPKFLIGPMLEEKNTKLNTDIEQKEKELEVLKQEVEANKKLLVEINIFKKREEKLRKIEDLAKDLADRKSSPHKIMLRMAKNVPEDLWLDHLEIDSNKNITIKGGSLAYKSVGSFVTLMNESIFFDKTLDVVNLKTIEDNILREGNRMESFEIKGNVKVFDIEDSR